MDLSETYNLVIKPSTIRVVLALAVQQGWDIRQLEVNNALKKWTFTRGCVYEST